MSTNTRAVLGTQPASTEAVIITNARPEHAQSIVECAHLAYGVDLANGDAPFMRVADVRQQIRRFPEGQFVALANTPDGRQVVAGYASTMRTNYSPMRPPLAWIDQIGSKGIKNHHPHGI